MSFCSAEVGRPFPISFVHKAQGLCPGPVDINLHGTRRVLLRSLPYPFDPTPGGGNPASLRDRCDDTPLIKGSYKAAIHAVRMVAAYAGRNIGQSEITLNGITEHRIGGEVTVHALLGRDAADPIASGVTEYVATSEGNNRRGVETDHRFPFGAESQYAVVQG